MIFISVVGWGVLVPSGTRQKRRQAKESATSRHSGSKPSRVQSMFAKLAGVTDRSWTLARVVAIASGGAAGATTRWALLAAIPHAGPFPWNVLIVNIAGSLILGALLAEEWGHPRLRLLLHDAGAIGFCGGLTTFSTYAVGVVDLLDRHRPATAVAYTFASMLTTLLAVIAGAGALRHWRAAGRPVDEAP